MLSTTSFAVLGMLAIRPWSAYDLTKQMRRSLAYCWPKVESVLYDEPKRLVRLGLASVGETPSGTGRRTRAVYSITDSGRTALREWLGSQPEPPRFELEPLVRLLYADQGSKEDVVRMLTATRTWARQELERGLEQMEGYRDDGGPFPRRLHITVLFADLVARLLDAVEGWTVDAEAEIATWPGTADLGMTASTEGRLGALIERAHVVLARSPTPRSSGTHVRPGPVEGSPYATMVRP